MDRKNVNQYVFNMKVARLFGLNQILNPDTTNIYGYNVCRPVIYFWIIIMFVVLLLSPLGLYKRLNDPSTFSYYIGTTNTIAFSLYKVIHILCYSTNIWECINIANVSFLKYHRYDINIFKNWQKRTHRVVCTYLMIITIPYVTWTIIPCFISQPIINMRNLDGTYSLYRLNCFNLEMIVSDEIYNRYFYAFYFIEFIVISGFYYFSIIFDILVIWLCFAFSCQLETVCCGIETLLINKCPNDLSGKLNVTNLIIYNFSDTNKMCTLL